MSAFAMTAVRAELLANVPDAPEWVEARGMVLDDAAWAIRSNTGWLIGVATARLAVAARPRRAAPWKR